MSEQPTPLASRAFDRTFELEDISIRAGGDGRTVVAYAAVFDTQAEVRDQDGHYLETITRSAFDRTLNALAGRNVPVFYNHAKTMYGTPSERGSLPIGRSLELRTDQRGLYTVSQYNNSPLANDVLDSIRNGDITGQSFSGRFVQSRRQRSRSGLDTIERSEVKLTEYGPTPVPTYMDAAIVGVRAEDLAETLRSLSDEDKERLFALLSTPNAVSLPSGEPASSTSPDNDNSAERHLSGHSQSYRERVLLLAGVI